MTLSPLSHQHPVALVNGEPQRLSAVAAENGLSPQAVQGRLNRGWPPVAAIMLPVGEVLVPKARVAKPTPRPRGRPTTLFVDTPEGPVPALELAKKNGVPRATMYDRIERKWPLEKAVSVPAHNYGDPARQLAPPRPRAPADKTTHTREIRALAAKNGISEQLYYYRVANGWSQEKASTHPPYHRPERLKGTRRAT